MLSLGTTHVPDNATDPSPRADARRVLVVDDTEAQRYAVARTLQEAGYAVTEAASGGNAIALAAAGAFDAIVLDVHLPDMDGFAVGRELRESLGIRIPILHLSAQRVSARDRIEGLTNGGQAYLTHPFDAEELVATIGALIRMAAIDRQHQSRLAANSLLTEALDSLGDHIALLDGNGVIVAVNEAWERFAEANHYADGGSGIGLSYISVCDGARGANADEAPAVADGIRDVLAARKPEFVAEYPCHAPSEQRWFEMTVRRVSHPGANGVAALVAHRNVTAARLAALEAEAERRRAEREHAARAREDAVFRALTEQSHEFVAILNEDGAFRYIGPSVTRTLGYEPEDLLGRYPVELVHDADRDTMIETYRALRDGPPGHTAEMTFRLRHRDGSWRYFEGAGRNLLDHPAIRGITSVSRDVTARVEEHERLVAVFENAPSFLAIVHGPEYRVERANAAFERLMGGRRLAGVRLTDLVAEGQAAELLATLDHVSRTGETVVRRAVPVDRPRADGDGMQRRYIDVIYQRLVEIGGSHRIVVHGLDLTNHVETVLALRSAEALLQDQFAKIPVPTGLWECRPDAVVLLDFNEAALPFFGSRDVIGKRVDELFPEIADLLEEARQCLVDGSVLRRTVEFDLPAAGRRTFNLTVGAQPPDRLLVHATDVTEEKRLTDALRQAQKMEAVGQLAGGVAHDFNNLLTVIGAHTNFLLEQLGPGSPGCLDAEAIQQAADRAAALTRQLLAFSRKQMVTPVVVDINRTVLDVNRLLARVIAEDIHVMLALSDNVSPVIIDPGQLEQVIVNLVMNARDAMPYGGLLTIATENVVVGDGQPPDFIVAGKYARLSIIDTGVGMDETTRTRVFEPFFTTKEPGKGTGMGLSMVYGIVKQASGYVTVQSEPERGARLDVYLPVATAVDAGTVSAAGAHPPASQLPVPFTILVAEDDEAVRWIVQRTLTGAGFDVIEATDGRAAMQLAESHEGPIDLVVTDAIMPGMCGMELIDAVRERHPAARALVVSGYAGDEMTRRGILAAHVDFLPKPFTPSDLVRHVRHLLGN